MDQKFFPFSQLGAGDYKYFSRRKVDMNALTQPPPPPPPNPSQHLDLIFFLLCLQSNGAVTYVFTHLRLELVTDCSYVLSHNNNNDDDNNSNNNNNNCYYQNNNNNNNDINKDIRNNNINNNININNNNNNNGSSNNNNNNNKIIITAPQLVEGRTSF